MYRFYDAFGHRYDLHTPPDHYQHDHQLVLDLAMEYGSPCRLLDLGCGTGVLVAKARAAGIEAYGLDASPGMVAVARRRLPADAVRLARMQELDEQAGYKLIVALSWSIHYCADEDELRDVLARIHRALVPGGGILLQVAHAPSMTGEWYEDREAAPDGTPDGVRLRYRFTADAEKPRRLWVDYGYAYPALGESVDELHQLEGADVQVMAEFVREAGFHEVAAWGSWRRDPFEGAGSGFVWGKRGD